jgi:hypothetical protein
MQNFHIRCINHKELAIPLRWEKIVILLLLLTK